MICFTIALRSKESTNQWDKVLRNFNNTLHSVFNQTCSDFRVYVGCNEIPELFDNYDDRLRFVTVDLPVPKTWEEGCRDRSWKLLSCAREIRKDIAELSVCGGGLLFFLLMQMTLLIAKLQSMCNSIRKQTGLNPATDIAGSKATVF